MHLLFSCSPLLIRLWSVQFIEFRQLEGRESRTFLSPGAVLTKNSLGLPLLAVDNNGERAFWCSNQKTTSSAKQTQICYASLVALRRAGLVQETLLEESQGATGVAISSPYLVTVVKDDILIFNLSDLTCSGSIRDAHPQQVALGAEHIVWIDGLEKALKVAPLASPTSITTINHDHQSQQILCLAAGDNAIWLLTSDGKLVKLLVSANGPRRLSFDLPEEVQKKDLSRLRIHPISKDTLVLSQAGGIYYVQLVDESSLDIAFFDDPAHGISQADSDHGSNYLITSVSGWSKELASLVIIGDSTSPDIVCGGVDEKGSLRLFFLQSEEGLPQLPLSQEEAEDTFPAELVLDYTDAKGQDSHPVDPDTSQHLPPQPLLWVLTSEGRLCPFSVVKIDQTQAHPLIKHKMEATEKRTERAGEEEKQGERTKDLKTGQSLKQELKAEKPKSLQDQTSLPGKAMALSLEETPIGLGGFNRKSPQSPSAYTPLDEILREEDQLEQDRSNNERSSHPMTISLVTEDLGLLQNAIVKEALALQEAWNDDLDRIRYQSDELYQQLVRGGSLVHTELPAISTRLAQASRDIESGLCQSLEQEAKARSLVISLTSLRLLAGQCELGTLAGQVQEAIGRVEELVKEASTMENSLERVEYLKSTVVPVLEAALSLLPVSEEPLEPETVWLPMDPDRLAKLHQQLRRRQPKDLITVGRICQTPKIVETESNRADEPSPLDQMDTLLKSLPPIPSTPAAAPVTTPLEPPKIPARVRETASLFAVSRLREEKGVSVGSTQSDTHKFVAAPGTQKVVSPASPLPTPKTESPIAVPSIQSEKTTDSPSMPTVLRGKPASGADKSIVSASTGSNRSTASPLRSSSPTMSATAGELLSSPLIKSGKGVSTTAPLTTVAETVNIDTQARPVSSPKADDAVPVPVSALAKSPISSSSIPSARTTTPSVSSSFGFDFLQVRDKEKEETKGGEGQEAATPAFVAAKEETGEAKGPSVFSLPSTVLQSATGRESITGEPETTTTTTIVDAKVGETFRPSAFAPASGVFSSGPRFETTFGQPASKEGGGFGTLGSISSAPSGSVPAPMGTGPGSSATFPTFGTSSSIAGPSPTAPLAPIASPAFGQPTSFGFTAIPPIPSSSNLPSTAAAPSGGGGFAAYATTTFGQASSLPSTAASNSSPFGALAQQQQVDQPQTSSIFGPASTVTGKKEGSGNLSSSFTQFRG